MEGGLEDGEGVRGEALVEGGGEEDGEDRETIEGSRDTTDIHGAEGGARRHAEGGAAVDAA